MQVLLLTSLLLGVSFVSTASVLPKDAEDKILMMIECVRQAMDGGLPAAGIPDHNPLRMWSPVQFPISLDGAEGLVNLTNVAMSGIVNFEVASLNGTFHEDIEELDIDYLMHHHRFALSGNFIFNGTVDGEEKVLEGNFDCALNHMNITGVWNMRTNPNSMTEFTLLMVPESIDVVVSGIDPETDADLSEKLSAILWDVYHSEGHLVWFAELASMLETRLNTIWLPPEYNYKIDAVLENCGQQKLFG